MSTPVDDVANMRAILDRSGIGYEESYTGASEGGFRTYFTIKSDATSSETVLAFNGQNKLVAINSYERA